MIMVVPYDIIDDYYFKKWYGFNNGVIFNLRNAKNETKSTYTKNINYTKFLFF